MMKDTKRNGVMIKREKRDSAAGDVVEVGDVLLSDMAKTVDFALPLGRYQINSALRLDIRSDYSGYLTPSGIS